MENQPFEDVSPIENGDFPLPFWFWWEVACAIFGVPQLTGSSCSTSLAKEKLTGEAGRGKFQHFAVDYVRIVMDMYIYILSIFT